MSNPVLMLGGVPIVLHAGAPELSVEGVEGASTVRMSLGALVKMTHWNGKARGSITGNGWMPPGLDGLDYSQPLELRSTQPETITTPATSAALSSTPRPDAAPWALALIGREWVRTGCVYEDGVATATPVAGAAMYAFYWLPVYQVFATKPPKGLSVSTAAHSWSIAWEEI
jgi:hypothetical protein